MMRSTVSTIRLTGLLLAGAVLLAISANTWGQPQAGTKKELEEAYNSTRSNRFKTLSAGDDQPTPADAKVMEAAAQYSIYPITHRASLDAKGMAKVQTDFENKVNEILTPKFVDGVKKSKNNRAFIKMFGPALVKSMEVVMAYNPADKEPETAIRAAMMLNTMARLRDDTIADGKGANYGINVYLAKLINDPNTHDAVRIYAIKAMRETMPITVQPEGVLIDLDGKPAKDKRDYEIYLVNTLAAQIERVGKPKVTSEEDIAVARFMRREAIASLAAAGSPAVLALTKKEVNKPPLMPLQGAVAPTLLKVLAKGELDPAPTLQERIEAAVGLCNMKYRDMSDYDPALANFLIGKTIVDFLDDYNVELGKIAIVGAGRKIPAIAYRTEGKRLFDGVSEFAANAKTKQATDLKAYAQTALVPLTRQVLKEADQFPQIDAAKLRDLKQQLPSWRPTAGKIFKTLPAPVINLGE